MEKCHESSKLLMPSNFSATVAFNSFLCICYSVRLVIAIKTVAS